MSRAWLPITAQDTVGNVIAGGLVTLYEFGTTTPIPDTLYRTADGMTTYAPSERLTNSLGWFEAWMTTAKRMTAVISKNGVSQTYTVESTWDQSELRPTAASDVIVTVPLVLDGVLLTDAVMARGSAILTSASASFTQDDVGKAIRVREATGAWQTTLGSTSTGIAAVSSAAPFFTTDMVGYRIQVGKPPTASYLAASYATITVFNHSQSVQISTTGTANAGPDLRIAIAPPILETTIATVIDANTITLADAAAVNYLAAEADYGTDNTDIIQATLDDLPDGDYGRTVRLTGGPNAMAGLGGSVTVPSRVTFESDGVVLFRLADNTSNLFKATVAISDVSFTGVTFDHRHGGDTIQAGNTGGWCTYFVAGSERLSFDRCTYQNLAPGGAFAVWFDGTNRSSDVTVHKCTFTRSLPRQGATGENEASGTFAIYDCDDVTVEHSLIENVSSFGIIATTKTIFTEAAPMKNPIVQYNTFRGIRPSSVQVYPGGNDGSAVGSSSWMRNVQINHNLFEGCGLDVEKGPLDIFSADAGATIEGLSVIGNTIRGWGYAGSSGGYSQNNPPGAMLIGGPRIRGLRAIGNDVDGRKLDGTLPTGAGVGIYINNGVVGGSVADNSVRNCGSGGIVLDGQATAGLGVRHISVNGNYIEGCSYINHAEHYSGISLTKYCQGVEVIGNTSVRNGADVSGGNWYPSGIGLGIPTGGGSGSSGAGLSDIVLMGNVCYDDRGTPYQQYGIKINEPVSITDAPVNLVITGNPVRGNVRGGLYYSTSDAHLTWNIHSNPGTEVGTAPLTDTFTARKVAKKSAAFNPTSIANNSQYTTTVVISCAFGDRATAWLDISQAGLILDAYVSTADQVTIVLTNNTGGAVDLGASNLYVAVERMVAV